jgi:hypothetical protein
MQTPTALSFPQRYQIQVREYLDNDFGGWFYPLTLAHTPDGITMLTGVVRDQAELHGLLIKIRDLNLTLLLVIHQ